MIAEYEAGLAPDCSDCRSMMDCQYSAAACQTVVAGNELLSLCYESACLIARIHDVEKRRYMAGANADAWADVLPDGWFDERDYMAACHVPRVKVVA